MAFDMGYHCTVKNVIYGFTMQFGNLLGCTTGLMQQVTGVTFIALGTSLPDTIASRTAALQDDTADAAIGNVTGSNRLKSIYVVLLMNLQT